MDPRKAYSEDPRIPCHYGRKCYQKNPNHHTKYKHPPDPKRKKHFIHDDVKRKKLTDTVADNKTTIDQKQIDNDENSTKVLSETSEESPKKKEVLINNNVSDSESESESKDTSPISNADQESIPSSLDVEDEQKPEAIPCSHENGHNNEYSRNYIKSKFLLEMPKDFYEFFSVCERLNPKDPSKALESIGLKLVGPFDVLCGKFCGIKKKSEDYLIHWRYYFDPPNFVTVLKGDDKTGYHIGYFWDNPSENPVFLAENCGLKDGILTPIGGNIFGAVSSYIEDKKKTCDPFTKMKFNKIQNEMKEGEKLGYDLSRKTKEMGKRNNKVLSRTFNKIGLVVPYERKTQLGYRKLAMSDKALEVLLTKIDKAGPENKSKFLGELQSEILTWTDIACDECDFGTGIELGWDILCHGVDLNHTTARLLASNYRQLKWEEFAKIAEAHMGNRRRGCDLSIL
ncbi:histone PARylation factor 1 [Coccinella septempunctata]|uniref:histone PARylation factor 1 n=1 Tax=Coccinella septempunctata TaxID=41139 RepID=UPI001D06AC66|nr:histone PARylation factor 1 [Coccinella septempunctata]